MHLWNFLNNFSKSKHDKLLTFTVTQNLRTYLTELVLTPAVWFRLVSLPYLCVFLRAQTHTHVLKRNLGWYCLLNSSSGTSTCTVLTVPTPQLSTSHGSTVPKPLVCDKSSWFRTVALVSQPPYSQPPQHPSPSFGLLMLSISSEIVWHNRKDMGFGVRCTQVRILSKCVTLDLGSLHLLYGDNTYITQGGWEG